VTSGRLLVLRVNGGLGNRLRALVTAQVWARQAKRSLRVVWPVNHQFGAPLRDLFTINVAALGYTPSRIVARVFGGYQDVEAVRLDDPRRVVVVLSGGIFTVDERGAIPLRPLLQRLQPTVAIAARVRSVATWTQPTVGVMIRANTHAHGNTLQHSPVSWYLERMAAMRAVDPDVPFFLSTDSPEASAVIHQHFDGVIEQSNKHPYNSRAGVAEAVTDLYCLAATTYILGAHYSSFSETAALLSGHRGYETSRVAPVEAWDQRRHIATTSLI
jgi:hypothetical protein